MRADVCFYHALGCHGMHVSLCVCACVRACVCACVRACVRACLSVCLSVCVSVCLSVYLSVKVKETCISSLIGVKFDTLTHRYSGHLWAIFERSLS